MPQQLPLFGPLCEAIIDLRVDGVTKRGIVCGYAMERYCFPGFWNCEPEWAEVWKCPTCGAEERYDRERYVHGKWPVLMTLDDDEV